MRRSAAWLVLGLLLVLLPAHGVALAQTEPVPPAPPSQPAPPGPPGPTIFGMDQTTALVVGLVLVLVVILAIVAVSRSGSGREVRTQ